MNSTERSPSATSIPYILAGDVTQEELLENLGDLLAWALKNRLGDILEAGVTSHEIMKLRAIVIRFQTSQNTISDLSFIRSLFPKLEKIRLAAIIVDKDQK